MRIFWWVFLISGTSFSATASTDVTNQILKQQSTLIRNSLSGAQTRWHIGDEDVYQINLGPISGNLVARVAEIETAGVWVDQKIDMGLAGSQRIRELIDPQTGKTLRIFIDGVEQNPANSETETISTNSDRVSVPAGTFDCMHGVLKGKKDGQLIEIWVNPQAVPLAGMVKMIQPSSLGKATLTLKSFKKAE